MNKFLALIEVKIIFAKVLNFGKDIETQSRNMNNRNAQAIRFKILKLF